MKLVCAILVFTQLIALPMFAQNAGTYAISNSVEHSTSKLEKALAKCNLDKYRKSDQRVVMKFADGTKVILFSVNEIMDNVSPSIKGKILLAEDLKNTFILTPEGYILEEVQHVPSLEQQKQDIINKQKKTAK